VIYLSAAFTCVILVELFIAVPMMAAIQVLLHNSNRASKVIASPKISDHWKEKVLVRYARNIMVSSFKIAFWLFLVLALGGGASLLLDMLLKPEMPTLNWLATMQGIIVATVFSILYFWLRSRLIKGKP
jgi:hypothetical protein